MKADCLNWQVLFRPALILCVGTMMLASVMFPLSAAAAKQEDKVMLNFVTAEIESVAKAISQITGRNFLVDPRVKGTVNIISSTPIPRSLTYDVFLSALRLQGFTAVESNGVIKLVPEVDAKFQNNSTGTLEQARGDRLVTHVFPLKHESANLLLPVLKPMISPNNVIVAYPQNNILVITDYAENLHRIQKVIEAIDLPGNLSPEFIPLTNATAAEVAQTIRSLLGEQASEPNQKLVILPDPRSNSLIVRADDPVRLARIKEFAAKIDGRTNLPASVRVLYLKNAEAVKVAETLRNIVTAFQAPGATGGSVGAGLSSSSTGTLASAAASGSASLASPSGGGASSSAGTIQPASFSSGSGQSTAAANVGGISIQADAAINALVITAPDSIFNNLKAVVEKLDTRRTQVYVEALIVELRSDKAAEFGIQWQDLSGFAAGNAGKNSVIGGTNFLSGKQGNILGASKDISSVRSGLNLGIMRGTVKIPGLATEVTSLGALASMLESTGSGNILSAPNIMTLDNEEAALAVGSNVPVLTGQQQQTTGLPFQTIERKDIGLLLRIRPQVSEGGVIRMRIYQEVSKVADSVATGTQNQGATFDKRSINTNVLVDDGEIIVIGGLMEDTFEDKREQVPLLGDIPVLGALFRYDTKSRKKTNLMVFLRPVVIRDTPGYRDLTGSKYGKIRREQEDAKPNNEWLMSGERGPVIPLIETQRPATAPVAQPK